MKRNTLLAAMTLTATVLGGAAFAESHHGHGGKSGPGAAQGGAPGMMGMMEGMDGMMDMMQRMHGNMMGGGMMGVMGPMGGGMTKMLDADGDGKVTPEEMRTQLQAKLAEYDGDGDGSLSIAEFETLHSAMIREMMVDRFQHLDADGDGGRDGGACRNDGTDADDAVEHGAVAGSARQWPGHGRRHHDERQLRGSAPALTGAASPNV